MKLLFIIILGIASILNAVSKPITTDSRIKVFVYNEYEVYPLLFHHQYMSHIDFPHEEKVQSVSLGDSTGWRIDVTGNKNRIYIQPIEAGVQTNMNIMTNKRNYELDVYSIIGNMNDELDVTYSLRFFYPPDNKDEDENNLNQLLNKLIDDKSNNVPENKNQHNESINIDQFIANIKQYSKLNINYTFSGTSDKIPLEVFDDNKMTYIIFAKNMKMPGKVGHLDENNNFHMLPSIVNKNTLILNKVNKKTVLHHSDEEYLVIYKN